MALAAPSVVALLAAAVPWAEALSVAVAVAAVLSMVQAVLA